MRIVSYNVRYFGHATRGIASTRRAVTRIAAEPAKNPSFWIRSTQIEQIYTLVAREALKKLHGKHHPRG